MLCVSIIAALSAFGQANEVHEDEPLSIPTEAWYPNAPLARGSGFSSHDVLVTHDTVLEDRSQGKRSQQLSPNSSKGALYSLGATTNVSAFLKARNVYPATFDSSVQDTNGTTTEFELMEESSSMEAEGVETQDLDWLDNLDQSIRQEADGSTSIPKRFHTQASRKVANALNPEKPNFMRGDSSRVVKDLTAGGVKTIATVQELAEAFMDETDDQMPGEMTFAAYLIVKFGKHNLEAFAIGMALLIIMAIGINTCWADVERLSLRQALPGK